MGFIRFEVAKRMDWCIPPSNYTSQIPIIFCNGVG